MALIVEDGSAVPKAESYISVADADAYWAARTHDSQSTVWSALTTPQKEGSLRESTAYLDATYGNDYKGIRRGYVQGLLWPRTGALDEAGYPLPDLPDELKKAAAELAVRASSERLAVDSARGGLVKRTKDKVGPLEQEIEYVDGATINTSYGSVNGILAGILVGGGPGGRQGWAWA